jgi:nucleotide-binding universal stress UspA family protein
MNVLIPVDGSDHNNRIVDYVALHWLPADPALGIILCHTDTDPVVPEPTGCDADDGASLCSRAIHADTALHYARTVFASVGLRPTEHTLCGPPIAGVLELARDSGAHVIVLGARGSDAQSLGSAAALIEKILSLSSVPVLVLP